MEPLFASITRVRLESTGPFTQRSVMVISLYLLNLLKWKRSMTITAVMPCQVSLLINLTMSHVMFKQLLQPVFKANNIAICLTALMTVC